MTAGEGGMLTTNDAAFAERAWSIMDQGRKPGGGWFHHYLLGSNYRITGLQAAVLLAQLERLPEQICRRTRNAALLRARTGGCAGAGFQTVAAAAERELVVSVAGPHRRPPHGPHARRVSSRADRARRALYAVLSASALRQSAISGGRLPRGALPGGRSVHRRRLLAAASRAAGRRGNHAGDRRCHTEGL